MELRAMPASNHSWAKDEQTRRVMLGNRGRDTRPELEFRRAAHALGLRYRTSARPLAHLRRTADLVFSGEKVAVFVDGCFWHGCPIHHVASKTNEKFWTRKIADNVRWDRETDRLLLASDWLASRPMDDPLEIIGDWLDALTEQYG